MDAEACARRDKAGDARLRIVDREELARIENDHEPALDGGRRVKLLTLDVLDSLPRMDATPILDCRRRELARLELHRMQRDRDSPLSEGRLGGLNAPQPLVEHLDTAAGLDRRELDRLGRLGRVELLASFLTGFDVAKLERPTSHLRDRNAREIGQAKLRAVKRFCSIVILLTLTSTAPSE